MKRKATNLPIVVPKASAWCDTVPQRIIDSIYKQRLEQLEIGTFGELATDAEVLLFLYCLGLTTPLDNDYVGILLFVLNKTVHEWGIQLPKTLRMETLPQYLKEKLRVLKREIRAKSLKK